MALKKDPNQFSGAFASVDKTAPAVTKTQASPFDGAFSGVGTGDAIGSEPRAVEPTTFRKVQTYKAQDEINAVATKKANSFGTLAAETLNPINLGKSLFDIAKSVVSQPLEAARAAAIGVSNGITLGGVDYLQRKAFTDAAAKGGIAPHEAEQMATKLLAEHDPNLQSIRGGFDIAGAAVPYILTDGVVAAGLKYAAPAYVARYAPAVRVLSNIGVFNALGQTSQSFMPGEEQHRGSQAAIDTALAVLFPVGGAAFNRAKAAFSKGAIKASAEAVAPDFRGEVESTLVPDIHKNVVDGVAHDNPEVGKLLAGVDTSKVKTVAQLEAAYRKAIPKNMMTPQVEGEITNWSKTGGIMVDEYSKMNPSEWRSIRATQMAQPTSVTPVTNTEPLIHTVAPPTAPAATDGAVTASNRLLGAGEKQLALPSPKGRIQLPGGEPAVKTPAYLTDGSPVISSDALQEGAQRRIKELEALKNPTTEEKADLAFLKKNAQNVNALYEHQQNPPKQNVPVPNASSAMKVNIPVGAKDVPMNIASSDMEALQSFIKGSGEIDYRVVDRLGKDAAGQPIQARHEFNPQTGRHTIYVTNETDAESLAHELGHYFDTSVTNSTRGLARILPDYVKNQEPIEDVLGAMAVKRLGGNATAEAVSAEIKNISESIQRETSALSAMRAGGKPATSASEKFADGVSMVLTRPGSKEAAPTLTELLSAADKFDKLSLFGKDTGKAINDVHASNAEPTLLSAKEPKAMKVYGVKGTDLSSEEGVTLAKNKTVAGKDAVALEVKPGAKILSASEVPAEIQGDRTATMTYAKEHGFDLVGDDNGMNVVNKNVLSTPASQVVEKPVTPRERKGPTLPREPTGHQPDTPAFRAEKITTDTELETFMNTKILSKLEGTERIGKTNDEIITRSFSSNLTEKSFDKILTERFGNLSEDVLAAKRLMTEKAGALSDQLAGRDISQLTATEMRDVMKNYQQTVEMFETFAGVRTELSNSFRTLGIAVNKGENDALRSALGDIQTAIGDNRDPFGVIKSMLKSREKGAVEYYFEVWYPSLLSGWKTSARNITGNASNLVFDTLSSLFTKTGRQELPARIDAIIKANKEGLNNASEVLKDKQFIDGKFYEAPAPEDKVFKGPFAFLNKVEYVGRFLNAQDAYFSNAFKRSEVAAQRVGDFSYGLENKEAAGAINDAVATAAGARGTFRNPYEKTLVGKFAQAVTSLKVGDVGASKVIANFIFPFVRTIANITDRQLDYLPLVNIQRTFFAHNLYEQRANRILADAGLGDMLKKDAIDGGMTLSQASQYANGEVSRVREQVISRLRNQQLGKFYMGMTAMAAGIPAAASGMISGTGPKGKNERAVLMKTGWRPNSVKVGDTWLPYQNLALPMAAILSGLGNVHDAMAYGADNQTLLQGVQNGLAGFMRSETEQSFLSGLSTLFDPDITPEQKFSSFATNAIPIPALWTQTKDAILPERYDTKSIGESISTKIGTDFNVFTGKPLQPKLDAFGDPVKADLIYGLTPPVLNAVHDDPVLTFMQDNRAFIGKPQPSTQITGPDGSKRKISPDEYTKYVQTSGKAIYEEIHSEIQGGAFTGLTHEEIKNKLNSIAKQKRAEAKSQINY